MSRRLCAVLLALLLPVLLTAAPAPSKPAKKPQEVKILGDWTEKWGDWSYDRWFRDDATCGGVGYGDVWRGTWSLRGRTLYVTEECGGRTISWMAELDGNLAGVATITHDSQGEAAGKKVKVRFTWR